MCQIQKDYNGFISQDGYIIKVIWYLSIALKYNDYKDFTEI